MNAKKIISAIRNKWGEETASIFEGCFDVKEIESMTPDYIDCLATDIYYSSAEAEEIEEEMKNED
ncbi:hypothetical protein LCGC14_1143500 [marine sediment metagenome]|uniref:Uncharacterized protein n=1 Tax=marine sediment metagenome TaxID=412755 RepID=A0A0F9Q3B8_9ZZZZ